MSAETITVDGSEYVLLPHWADWSREPELSRRWETKVAEGITGAEDRARVRATPLYTLKWSVTPGNEQEEARIEARMIAAKLSGYAAAPWFGRGMIVVTADSGDATITVRGTPWLPDAGDWVILMSQTVNSEPVYDAIEVVSVLGNVITIDGTLSRDWSAGSICYPVIAGEFTGESHEMLTGKIGTWNFAIEAALTPPPGGGLQMDGFQAIVGTREDYTVKWGPYIQADGYQAVVAGIETRTEVWEDNTHVDGFQAVVVVLETVP